MAMTRFTSTDPATGETVWEGAAASPAQVEAAVDAARAAFPDWADRPRQDRIDAVKRYQAVLKDRAARNGRGHQPRDRQGPVGDQGRAGLHGRQGRHLDPRL